MTGMHRRATKPILLAVLGTSLLWSVVVAAHTLPPPPVLKPPKFKEDSKVVAGTWGGVSAGVGLSLPLSPKWFRVDAKTGYNLSAGIALRPKIKSNHRVSPLISLVVDYCKYPTDAKAVVQGMGLSVIGARFMDSKSSLLFASLQFELGPAWVDRPLVPYFLISVGAGRYKSGGFHVYAPGYELHRYEDEVSVAVMGIGAGVRRDFGLAASIHAEIRWLPFGVTTSEQESSFGESQPLPSSFDVMSLEFRLRTTVPLFY